MILRRVSLASFTNSSIPPCSRGSKLSYSVPRCRWAPSQRPLLNSTCSGTQIDSHGNIDPANTAREARERQWQAEEAARRAFSNKPTTLRAKRKPTLPRAKAQADAEAA